MSGIHRTSLTAHVGRMRQDEEPDPREGWEHARNAYIASGGKMVLINTDWMGDNWADRLQLDLLAEKYLDVKRMG